MATAKYRLQFVLQWLATAYAMPRRGVVDLADGYGKAQATISTTVANYCLRYAVRSRGAAPKNTGTEDVAGGEAIWLVLVG